MIDPGSLIYIDPLIRQNGAVNLWKQPLLETPALVLRLIKSDKTVTVDDKDWIRDQLVASVVNATALCIAWTLESHTRWLLLMTSSGHLGWCYTPEVWKKVT